MNDLKALGNKVTSFEGFDTFPTPEGVDTVVCTSSEVTANCPVTNQPDWYTVEITYKPRKHCVESKTLKLYLHSFRNEGIFCEAIAAKISKDLLLALRPSNITVRTTQTPRGGISIISTSSRRFHNIRELDPVLWALLEEDRPAKTRVPNEDQESDS